MMVRNYLLLLLTLSVAIVLSLAVFGRARAAHEYLEEDYQAAFCAPRGGDMEYLLDDRSRVDCLFADVDGARIALEVDFGKKRDEGLGQAMRYGADTGLTPGVLLILEHPGDAKYLGQLQRAARYWGLPLRVWTMTPDDLRNPPQGAPGVRHE